MNLKKRKILLILHLPPPVHGAAMMGSYLKQSQLLHETYDSRFVNLTTASSLEDIGRASFSKITSFIRLLMLVRREVRLFRPDVVYVTPNSCAPAFYKDFLLVMMLKLMGCYVVAHYHNKGVAKRQHRILDHHMYRLFFKGLKVILLSDNLYIDVAKYVNRSNVFICPNGIPQNDNTKSVNLHNMPQLLFLSNLIISKGVLVLLDALQILKDRNCSYVCHFVGGETKEISAMSFSKEIDKRGLSCYVQFHGAKYGNEKDAFLNNADVLLFPSYNECFGLVLLEAMQHGLPCISTDEGAIPSIIDDGQTGFIVEKKNPKQLADRIQQLLSDADLRHSMGIAGRQKYEREYTLSVFEKRMVDIFQHILNEREQ